MDKLKSAYIINKYEVKKETLSPRNQSFLYMAVMLSILATFLAMWALARTFY